MKNRNLRKAFVWGRNSQPVEKRVRRDIKKKGEIVGRGIWELELDALYPTGTKDHRQAGEGPYNKSRGRGTVRGKKIKPS